MSGMSGNGAEATIVAEVPSACIMRTVVTQAGTCRWQPSWLPSLLESAVNAPSSIAVRGASSAYSMD